MLDNNPAHQQLLQQQLHLVCLIGFKLELNAYNVEHLLQIVQLLNHIRHQDNVLHNMF